MSTDEVPFGGDLVADREQALGFRVGTQPLDLSREFMADDHRRVQPATGPAIPLPYMEVGATDPCRVNPDEDVGRPDGRDRDLLELHSGSWPSFENRSHP